MKHEVVLKVKKELIKELQDALDIEEFTEETEVKRDTILKTFTAKFKNGYEADIKVCSGFHNCYVDAVLFDKNGYQKSVCEPSFELLGEYYFSYEGEEFHAEVIQE